MATFVSQFRYLLIETSENVYETDGTPLTAGLTASDGLGDTQFTFGETIDLQGDPDDYTFVGSFGSGWIGESLEGIFWLFTNDSTIADGTVINADTNPFTVCFLPGTMIATPEGPRAVETLAAGDLVRLADGRAVPVRWLGVQTIVKVFAEPLRSFPIRIAAGALGEGLPVRDLFVSPDHALFLDGALVQAGALVNGSTVCRVAEVPETFRYVHVELDEHALLLAEDVPAESFLDTVTRRRFDNAADYEACFGAATARIPEMAVPRVKSARQVPQATRRRLAERAAALGFGEAAAA
ncbi:Hint domain-containing protein [Pseudoxanthobacter sp. M-2]|uniref:Hint domain-containing protein n=1 Tax=Pseudoxanthobacter sp. M-2 TaxID=3078754 RepID=UPI0038FC6415